MDVIVTHINADFDCLGSLAAASRLYPGALLCFPGSQEKAVRDLLSRNPSLLPGITRARDINLDTIDRLIIVDCQQASRIGRFAGILERPGLEVHVFDHHPLADDTISATGGIIRACGSTSTLLAQLLMERSIDIDPAGATLMMLGIHEDTGRLLFPTTSSDDYRAAAWLLEHGADLKTVSDALSLELNRQQISLLKTLLGTLRTCEINGIPVSIAHASVDAYIGDIATLAHLLRDLENLDALFLAVEMDNRVYLIGRSRVSEVDAGAILRHFNGGGHASAASASVRGTPLRQVLEQLTELLHRSVIPGARAGNVMSPTVKTVPDNITISEAREQLTRYNCNAMPVMSHGAMLGIISRKIVEKALYHDLGDSLITDFMHTDFMKATPETPLSEIQRYMIDGNRRFVPVFRDGELAGVVTRTDLLRHMHGGDRRAPAAVFDLDTLDHATRVRSISGLITRRLPPATVELLKELGATADRLGMTAHAVGGFVRDLLLGAENLDIDITVEGDGIFFAEAFAAAHASRVRSHETFGTAVIIMPDGIKVDVASTRLEYYESPGALPTVERASLRHDLYRRDFTINTLAFCLNHDHFGSLTDYFGGQQDLQERVLRVLHNLSLVEDPTRVFRAVRFEQRLGFRIAPHTENLIRSSVRMRMLERVGGARLRNELVQMMSEKEPAGAISRMAQLGMLPYIHPALKPNQQTERIIAEAGRVLAWYRLLFLEEPCRPWQVYFFALFDSLQREEFDDACHRLMIREHDRDHVFSQRRRVLSVLSTLQQRVRHGEQIRNSELVLLFTGLATESVLYLAARARDEQIRRLVSLYITTLKRVRCRLGGDDLKQMGLEPGPRFGRIMQQLLAARLDGTISSAAEEAELARRLIAEMTAGPAAKSVAKTHHS